jgi:DNA-binding MarR family transcriptional regulator
VTQESTLETLIMAAHRLVRIAAAESGNQTPAAQWRTLSILQTDGPMRVGELAAASRVTQPGMTRLLATMSEEDLVARIADAADSRAWQIRITPKGARALAGWRRVLGEALAPTFADLDAEEWTVLERAATLLATHTASVDRTTDSPATPAAVTA